MRAFRVVAAVNGRYVSSGTGWLISQRHVVTAFHVVGAETDWITARPDAPTLQILVDGEPHDLSPLAKDEQADLALLELQHWTASQDDIAELATHLSKGASWSSAGYPELNDYRAFVMAGRILKAEETGSPDALQLLSDHPVNHRTRWEGMSGSAVETDLGVAGVVTRVQDDVNTAWATTISPLRRLLASCGVAPRERSASKHQAAHDSPPLDAMAGMALHDKDPYSPIRLVSIRGRTQDVQRLWLTSSLDLPTSNVMSGWSSSLTRDPTYLISSTLFCSQNRTGNHLRLSPRRGSASLAILRHGSHSS
jgi:hypothetical protein